MTTQSFSRNSSAVVTPFDFNVTDDSFFPDPAFTPDDFALSDFEVSDPFFRGLTLDSTSESSPEATGMDQTPSDQCTQSRIPSSTPGSIQQQRPTAPATISPAQWDALTQVTNRYNSLLEDVNDSPLENDFSSNQPTTMNPNDMDNQPPHKRQESSVQKRTKDKNESISACWTSPLCPNYAKEGTPPSPSTCGGGCAPFLFSNDINDLTGNDVSATQQAARDVEIDVEATARSAQANNNPRRQLKRRESSSKSGGRTRSSDSIPTVPEVKHESSPESQSPQDLSKIEATSSAKPKRMPHHQVERKYRETINTQLEALRRVVPSLQQPSPGNCNDDADIEDLPLPPAKPSKAVVLASATAHIKQVEKERRRLAEENQFLRQRVKALQALVKCEDCTLMQYIMDMKIGQTG